MSVSAVPFLTERVIQSLGSCWKLIRLCIHAVEPTAASSWSLWPPRSLSVMLWLMKGESDSWEQKQVWCKPPYFQWMSKDLIVSATFDPVKAVLLLVTGHSPFTTFLRPEDHSLLCLLTCENFLCEKKLCLIAKALKTWVWPAWNTDAKHKTRDGGMEWAVVSQKPQTCVLGPQALWVRMTRCGVDGNVT